MRPRKLTIYLILIFTVVGGVLLFANSASVKKAKEIKLKSHVVSEKKTAITLAAMKTEINREQVPEPIVADKQVALTFDDGPHELHTDEVLQLLARYHAKGTFFLLGKNVTTYPEIVKRIADAGHELGNHTWSHLDLTMLSDAAIQDEIRRTNDAIEQVTGQLPTVFRAPYGARDEKVKQVVGLPDIFWTVDTWDWHSHDPEAVLKNVEYNVTDGGIILMHDIYETSVEALELVLAYLHEAGYEFVTVSELNNRSK